MTELVDRSRVLAEGATVSLIGCDDGVCHVFAHLSDGISRTPTCGASVAEKITDEMPDDVCCSCAATLLRWGGMGEDEIARELAE